MGKIIFNHTSVQGEHGGSNNDRVLTAGFNSNISLGVFVIADGMGNRAEGGIASDMFCEEIRVWWKGVLSELQVKNRISLKRNVDKLDRVIEKINKKIVRYSNEKRKKIGTRGTVLFIYKNRYVIKHVGDCRVYILNDKLERITKEHSWAWELFDLGGITEKEYINHSNRKCLSNYFGKEEGVRVESTKGKIKGDNIFIMCTDGMYTGFHESGVSTLTHKEDEYKQGVKKFLQNVRNLNGKDDKTVILVRASC